jgi:hypothetical protein
VTGIIPDFNENMIRQRISTHGVIRSMEAESDIPALNIPPDQICVVHAEPMKRWLTAKQRCDIRYAKQKRRVQLLRGKEYIEAQKRGFLGGDLAGEIPPPSALAGRLGIQMKTEESYLVEESKKRKHLAAWMWSKMGGKEDKEREDSMNKVVKDDDRVTRTAGTIEI